MRMLFIGGANCPKCKALKPFMEKMCHEYEMEYEYVDAQDDKQYEERKGFLATHSITELPTIMIYNNNNEIILVEGFKLPGYFEEFICLQLDDEKKD